MSVAATVVSAWSPFIVSICQEIPEDQPSQGVWEVRGRFEVCATGELLTGHASV